MTTAAPAERAWPRQLKLPGQVAAPAGPVDVKMMYVNHCAFRRDLDLFARAVTNTPLEDRATWRALADRWEVFAAILHHHHSGEDAALWPFLLERVDEDGRAVLEAMESEHAEIDPVLEACRAGLRRLAEHPDPEAQAALRVRMTAGREILGRHMGHEETDAMRLVQDVMTPEQWESVTKAAFENDATLGFMLRMVPWLLTALPASVVDGLKTEAPLPMRLLWALTRGPFVRRDARTFRYAG